MQTKFKSEPRKFTFKNITISDMGKIHLENDEMISFVNNSGKECDFVQKSWGYYVCPSVNGRLKHEGFKTALTSNKEKRLYVLVVDKDKINEFKDYMKNQNGTFICWLDEWMEPDY